MECEITSSEVYAARIDMTYYRDQLGFEISWQWGDPPVRAGVCRDGLEIQLVVDGQRASTQSLRVYFLLRGVDQYYRECVDRGAEIISPVADRPFGVRDFRVVDLSGNSLGFGEPLSG